MTDYIFETERLGFRSFLDADLEELARISADEEGSRFVGDGQPLTAAQTRDWIRNSRRNVVDHGYGTGAVVFKNGGSLIGWAGIARPGDGSEEIVYGLDRAYWGQGLGSELLVALVEWAATALKLRELRATVDPENTASVRMLTNQGFSLMQTNYLDDPHSDLYVLDLCVS